MTASMFLCAICMLLPPTGDQKPFLYSSPIAFSPDYIDRYNCIPWTQVAPKGEKVRRYKSLGEAEAAWQKGIRGFYEARALACYCTKANEIQRVCDILLPMIDSKERQWREAALYGAMVLSERFYYQHVEKLYKNSLTWMLNARVDHAIAPTGMMGTIGLKARAKDGHTFDCWSVAKNSFPLASAFISKPIIDMPVIGEQILDVSKLFPDEYRLILAQRCVRKELFDTPCAFHALDLVDSVKVSQGKNWYSWYLRAIAHYQTNDKTTGLSPFHRTHIASLSAWEASNSSGLR